MTTLFDPLELGPITIKNRCFLAPMTRERCGLDGVTTEMHAQYFGQRACAGLIITGNNRVSPNGACTPTGPGLHNEGQVAAWRRVTEVVHAKGGRIFVQLFHAGAAGHPEMLPDSGYPVAPSAVQWGGGVKTAKIESQGRVPCVTPRALQADEIPDLVNQFRRASERALSAGFDGVEIHACSGYLLDQFLCSRFNRRTDRYGGDVVNRCRLLFEIFEAAASVYGPNRVGIKVSPEFNKHGVVVDDAPKETFSYIARTLSDLKPAYLHVADNSLSFDYHSLLRPLFRGVYLAGVGFMPERALSFIRTGKADAISFGRLFISNPDLPERIRVGAKLNALDPTTIYSGNSRGLLDYPTMEVAAAAAS